MNPIPVPSGMKSSYCDGTYSDTRSGTCGKPKLDVYEYQVVYLKPTDSLNRSYYYAPERTDDCSRYPKLNEQLICAINGSYQEDTAAKMMWMNEFSGPLSGFQKHHDQFNIRNKLFEDVYEYDVKKCKANHRIIYYNQRLWFVGYKLKTECCLR